MCKAQISCQLFKLAKSNYYKFFEYAGRLLLSKLTLATRVDMVS